MTSPTQELRHAMNGLQSDFKSLAKKFDEHQESTVREQRVVHDIVVATNEAIRNLARVVDEMKPLTDDYRLKAGTFTEAAALAKEYEEARAEKRGEEKYKNWLYGMAASIGGLIVLILSKAWDRFAAGH